MAKNKKGSTAAPNTTKNNGKTATSDYDSILQSMRLAQSVLQNDVESMQEILQEGLPSVVRVLDGSISIEKSLGESFTGGRSTPVYHVSCRVVRNGVEKDRKFIVKLVLMPDNSESNSQKLALRRESYAVEHRFYHAEYIQQYFQGNASLTIPKIFFSDLNGNKPWPAFCILMNDVSQQFPVHPRFLSLYQAQCALKWIATFHATFWGISIPPNSVWERGAFWTKSHSNNNTSSAGISSAWVGTLRFLEKYGHAVTSTTKTFGQRLQSAGPTIGAFLSENTGTLKGNAPTVRTLIHGDYKAANMFLKQPPSQEDTTEASATHVAVVDFQFTGAGIGAEDVAYLLYPDARGFFDADDEESLLKTYHDELISQLIVQQKGGPSSLSFSQFRRLYELSRLDMTRHWLAKGWVASTEGEAKLVASLVASMDRIDGGSALTSSHEWEDALETFIST